MNGFFAKGAGSTPAPFVVLVLVLISLLTCQPYPPTVTLAIMGDIMLGRGVNPGPDSFASIQHDLFASDLVLANLESPVSPNPPALRSSFNLCTISNRAEFLHSWGITLVSIANNHNLDCGPDGLKQTRSVLQKAGITPIGAKMEPVYLEKNNLHLAFLAFDDISSPLDEKAAEKAIRTARLTGAVVVVSIHWGAEYQGGASDRQKSLANEFSQAGAALVWGHHPHVLQPAVWIRSATVGGRDKKPTLVLYSLGNAIFDQGGLENTQQSALVVVTMDGTGVTSIHCIPFVIDVINSRVFLPDAGTAAMIRDRLKLP